MIWIKLLSLVWANPLILPPQGLDSAPLYNPKKDADVPVVQSTSVENWEAYLEDPLISKWVDFWVKIYGKIPNSEGLIHDTQYPEVVYEQVQVADLTPRNKHRFLKYRKSHWSNVLMSIYRKKKRGATDFNDEELKVMQIFPHSEDPQEYREASSRSRIRFQQGQMDSFKNAVVVSSRYLTYMERVFQEENVPIELTRLPFVESSFNLKARSKVGASGIWQFIRSTGRLYLLINSTVDERNDPIEATRAAARFLKLNYDSLRSWPLAVMAYNHGRRGVMRAAEQIKSTNIGDVIRQYRSRSFGFASKNFFMEFLAAVRVERHYKEYFGKLERDKPINYVEVILPKNMRANDLIKKLDMSNDDFWEYNPAFTSQVQRGRIALPKETRIRLPMTWGNEHPSGTRGRFTEIFYQNEG